jgi:centromere protein H
MYVCKHTNTHIQTYIYCFGFNLTELKQASRSKLLEIQIEKNKQKEDVDKMENSEMIKTMKKKLQTEIKITTVVQHTFQVTLL